MKGSDEKSWERKVVHWWCVHIRSRFSFLVEMFWKKGYWKTQKDQALTIHEKNEMKLILSMSGLQISETAKQRTLSSLANYVTTRLKSNEEMLTNSRRWDVNSNIWAILPNFKLEIGHNIILDGNLSYCITAGKDTFQ